MPYGWVAAAAVIGAGVQANAAENAADTQAGAARNAAGLSQANFNLINQQAGPYRQAGYTALNEIMARMAGDSSTPAPKSLAQIREELRNSGRFEIPGETSVEQMPDGTTQVTRGPSRGVDENALNSEAIAAFEQQPQRVGGGANGPGLLHQFNASDLGTNLSPSYNFMLQQGLGATQNALNASGGNVSGNTMRGMTQFAEDYAKTGYQQAFENYTANQTNIFNRLADVAGLGQTANQSVAGAGASLAGTSANALIQAGAAQAGGRVGAANALAGGGTSAASWYAAPQMIKDWRGTGTTTDTGGTGSLLPLGDYPSGSPNA